VFSVESDFFNLFPKKCPCAINQYLPSLAQATQYSFQVIAAFALYYFTLTHINKQLTGLWAYPIMKEAEEKFGFIGVVVFELFLIFIIFLLSLIGTHILQSQ
jgi:hypothetical protein